MALKVFDLQCAHGHVFEGWFASQDDYDAQQARGLVTCPVCNSAEVLKRLSAPRLNVGRHANAPQALQADTGGEASAGPAPMMMMSKDWVVIGRTPDGSFESLSHFMGEGARRAGEGLLLFPSPFGRRCPEGADEGTAKAAEVRVTTKAVKRKIKSFRSRFATERVTFLCLCKEK